VLAPLSVLLLHALYAALLDHRPWGWVLACAVVGVMLNVTLASLPLALVVATLSLLHHRRVCWREVLLGLCLIAITFVPYLYYEYRHDFRDVRTLVDGLTQRAGGLVFTMRAVQWAGWIHSGQNLSSLAGVSVADFSSGQGILGLLDRLVAWLFQASLVGVVALAIHAWSHWKERRDPARYLILALWLWVPLLVAPTRTVRLAPYSLAILYPAGFLAIGLVVDWAMEAIETHLSRRPWRALAQLTLWAVMLLMVAWQADSSLYLGRFVDHHDTRGGYGLPYRFWQSTVDMARRETLAAGTDQVWIVAEGSDVARDEQPMLLDYLLQPEVKIRFLGRRGSESLLLPAAQPAVYLLTRWSPPIERAIVRLGGETKGLVIFPGQELTARVKVIPPRPAEEMLGLIENRTFEALDSGACLLGYDWPPRVSAGEVVSFASYWTFLDIPPRETTVQHEIFGHLHASTGPLVAQCYGFGLPERYWSPGLVLVQWLDLPLAAGLPEGAYTLLLGMHRLSDLSRNRCIDDQGNDLGDAIRLGPFHLNASRTREAR